MPERPLVPIYCWDNHAFNPVVELWNRVDGNSGTGPVNAVNIFVGTSIYNGVLVGNFQRSNLGVSQGADRIGAAMLLMDDEMVPFGGFRAHRDCLMSGRGSPNRGRWMG